MQVASHAPLLRVLRAALPVGSRLLYRPQLLLQRCQGCLAAQAAAVCHFPAGLRPLQLVARHLQGKGYRLGEGYRPNHVKGMAAMVREYSKNKLLPELLFNCSRPDINTTRK